MTTSRGEHPRALLAPEEALELLLDEVRVLPPCPVPLMDAAGLVLAQEVAAPFDLPRFPNSAMDGFALRAADTHPAPVKLRVMGRALAGRPAEMAVGAGEAVTIATGGMLPDGADSVVPAEQVTVGAGEITVFEPVQPGRHVRRVAEDVIAGEVVIEAGTPLGPGQLAAAAALGFTRLVVHRRPRVVVVPTGDEVRPPGVPLAPAQIYDAVSTPLAVLIEELGAVPVVQPVVPDSPEGLAAALEQAAAQADAVITIGGVSVGEGDFLRRIQLDGKVRCLEIALRPCRPFGFGRIGDALLLALPGNPAAALAGFEELVRPALLAMLGKAPVTRPSQPATLTEPIAQTPGRLHLVRCRVWRHGDRLWARPVGHQGAGMVHSLAAANAWAIVPGEVSELAAGSEVAVRILTDPSQWPTGAMGPDQLA